MLRLRAIYPCSWRVFQFRTCSCKPLISQMIKCTDEEQVFDLIKKNKATFSEKQVECAFNILWQFQQQRTSFLKNVDCIRDYPHFLTLHNLATSQIEFMDDDTLVNVLYFIQQCAPEAHDLLVEALVIESWRRLERFDINVLSKFSSCLANQLLYYSPLMGKIADIVHRNLETIDDLRLKSTILLMSEELTSQQALAVMSAMEEMESRNSHLIKKIASILHKHLDDYKPFELLKITQTLTFLHFQSKELFVKLRELLLRYLKISVIPSEIAILVYALSILPSSNLCEVEISQIEAVLPQCDLNDLNGFATSVLRWIHYDRKYLDSTTGKQLKLLQKLDHYGLQRLRNSNSLNLLWKELKSLKGDWFTESLLEETVATLLRLMDEINSKNVAEIASFISRTNYLNTLLLDRIASVVVQQIEKIHPFEILGIILPFSALNYDPPQNDEFFRICIQHLNSYLSGLEPPMLVFLGFSLAALGYFPEDLLKAIFNIKFLSKMDSQLELLCSSLNRRVQFRLMELNRAVCLECPEYQIPWFHDRFCQQQYNKDIGSMNGAQKQIYKMLAEVLGGTNCVKASVLTPYYHRIDFECVLDKKKKPLPYGSHNITLGKLPEMHWESNTQITGSRLPPGAERIALQFLDSRAFCRNIPHLKGKSAMKKRHLEILGYHIIQIPHFEWNSMALSTKEARMDYLRERIFGEGKS
ncbi:FAST kinase domain-containing protein 1, mitochondrial isoform X2 [Canis lupus familiaris]|uniref:FAST kinase domain-containing protein 1, mitochondrial isoform X2 n=1 Tax=Canis lupus familiaris TaxID=9615 RepID=UPI0006B3DC30|nr:FAST kinase domain-containing protein 1, mitochondrial isoform X2 [Canis lupus familiaris]|eukprot:XP_013966250.1 FAST kinase domain-containing protein 1, mitochondrial isoform X2 [Canis lupus familiaris]